VAKQKFGLGRGLDALISGASDVISTQQSSQTTNDAPPFVSIDSVIPNPRQPRRVFRDDDAKLLELSASIKEHGLIQPIVVTRLDQEEKNHSEKAENSWLGEEPPQEDVPASTAVLFQIIAGERRWRASKLAGLIKVPVVIKDVSPQQMLELALIENIQRADLNSVEEALAYQQLIQEYHLTQEMVAKQVGKDRSTITNSLRLLQAAPKVREALMNQVESFSEGHARALLGLERDEDQVAAMEQIIARRLNVRQTEELVDRIKSTRDVVSAVEEMSSVPARSPELVHMESRFREALMVKVNLKRTARGKGTLVLHFNDQEELERLYKQLVENGSEADAE
jgi:ParB family chromosome partitioning protein